MRPDALIRAARTSGARLAYLTPTTHNPTTVTLSEGRRLDLVKAARGSGLTLIEDDPYALLTGETMASLAMLAPERTYHIATVSKCLTPGLRIAYVVTPDDDRQDRLVQALRAFTLMPAPLMIALLTLWIRNGTAWSLLEGVREEAAHRIALALSLLPETVKAHPNGLHVWQPLPTHWSRHRLIEAAQRQGLGITGADAFHVGGPVPDAVRISLGAVHPRKALADALQTIAMIIRNDRRLERAVV